MTEPDVLPTSGDERAGHHHLAVLVDGPDDRAAATGRPLNTG